MTVHTNWRDDVACRDADPDLFFPIGTTGAALHQVEQAKRLCRVCPAQLRCLAWALANGVTDGVWGGTTPDERRVIRSLSRRKTLGRARDDAAMPREAGAAEPLTRRQLADPAPARP